ncbi:unnamed protein product [Effrenium voratum]|uniref:Uncharacterized protein n=1 Tax=Effrenium voratum TaxID=2562239 RepID=A0AA36JGI4_9DINO|nr:unnamed protein product [Effrenium voratum]CAJ1414814.1 unnamed protein product [Effrenium voratum]
MASALALCKSQLASQQKDSLQVIVNKHVQDPALRELSSSQTSTERGLQRWEQAHLVSALDVINEYQRSRRARVFKSLGDLGPSWRRSYKNDPRTRMCELLKSWLRANAGCSALAEEEVRNMCGLCRDILSHPQLFPARNPQSFMKSMADVYDHLQWQLQEVLEKDRSCADLAQRLLSISRNLVTDTIAYLLLAPTDLKETDGLPSLEIVKLWQSLPNEGHPMPHRKDPALQKLMQEAWDMGSGSLIAALLRAPWCVRLFAGAEAESTTRLEALENGEDHSSASLESILKEVRKQFRGSLKGSGLVGALRADSVQRENWLSAVSIASDIMYLLGEVLVQFHRISDGLGDYGMIRVSAWLHPVLDALVEKVTSLRTRLEQLNGALDAAYVLARARGQKVQKPAPSEKMCFRAREAIQRAFLSGKSSHAGQMLQIADELRARSAPERLPHLQRGLGDACASLGRVLGSAEFRRHVGEVDMRQLDVGSVESLQATPRERRQLAIAPEPYMVKAVTDRAQDGVQQRSLEVVKAVTEPQEDAVTITPSRSERSERSLHSWSCCPTTPRVSEPGLSFEVSRLRVGSGRRDQRGLELSPGQLWIFGKGSSTKVKSAVRIPDGLDRVMLRSDKVLEMSVRVCKEEVMQQKEYIFEFASPEEADVFCEELWNQGVR